MAESFVQLPPNSTGSKTRTFQQVVGANTVEHPSAVLCDSSGNVIGTFASGRMPVETQPRPDIQSTQVLAAVKRCLDRHAAQRDADRLLCRARNFLRDRRLRAVLRFSNDVDRPQLREGRCRCCPGQFDYGYQSGLGSRPSRRSHRRADALLGSLLRIGERDRQRLARSL